MWTNIDNGVLRVALRIYFRGSLALLGIIGRQCCKLATKIDLLHGRPVSINRMTGWLRPLDILTCIWKLRTLPGGLWLGFVMIVTAALSLTADLAVSARVRSKPRHLECPFNSGLVMDWVNNGTWEWPPANQSPALLAANAQVFSGWNECPIGIYTKIDADVDASFCPTSYDILGTWSCQDVNQDCSFDPSASVDNITESLYQKGLQYGSSDDEVFFTDDRDSSGESTHLIVWSSSILNAPGGSAFDVRASVDLNMSREDVKTMRSFHCNVISDSETGVDNINSILKQMESNYTLHDWISGLQATIYNGDFSYPTSNISDSLAQQLNSLTMVQGGGNFVNASAAEDDFPSYGCILDQTHLPTEILALVGLTGLMLITVIIYWLVALTRLGGHALFGKKNASGHRLRNIKPIPDSTMSWVLQAARENAFGNSQMGRSDIGDLTGVPKKEGDLRHWEFSIVDTGNGNGVARLVRSQGSAPPQMVTEETVHGKN